MFDRSLLKFEIYQRLNKSPATPGFYTAPKVNSAIQEAIDLIATEMFENDEGFLKKIDYVDIEANAATVPIPPHMCMIEEVRYLVGNVYVPLAYDSQWSVPQWSITSGATQLPGTYKIIDNKFFFSPALGVGGDKYLQVEFQSYPSIIRSDSQKIDPQFDRCMLWYAIYRTCSILASAMGTTVKSWEKEEGLWRQKMINLVAKRTSGTTTIGEFSGW
jgi:hypothetical protein